MTSLLDDFQRRTRALVSGVGLLLRSETGSVGFGEFRRKTEKSVRLVTDTAAELLGGLPGAAGDREEGLRVAQARGLLNADEAGRWRGYFDGFLPQADAAYDDATFDRLRGLLLDARDLEARLRGA
ncbi:MAG TPA: hypothetical protein VF801_17475 [Rhodocyclaceae bacterium]